MGKRHFRIARGVGLNVSIIFVPKVASHATTLFNNHVQLTATEWVLIAAAGLLLVNAVFEKNRASLGNRLSLMLLVYQGVFWVGAVNGTSLLGVAGSVFWAGLALGVLLCLRVRLKPEAQSWVRTVLALDAVRLAAVIFLCSESLIATSGMLSDAGVFLTVESMLLPFIADWIRPGFSASVEGGRSLLGTARWILAFVVAGNLISWAATTDHNRLLGSAILMAFAYGVCYLLDPPDRKTRTAELLSVLGSGVANTLHLILVDTQLLGSPLLVGYGGFCLVTTAMLVAKQNR